MALGLMYRKVATFYMRPAKIDRAVSDFAEVFVEIGIPKTGRSVTKRVPTSKTGRPGNPVN